MATIRKRNGKYQVQVRIQGSTAISKTFTRLEDAKAWARLTEIEAEQIGLPADPRLLAKMTVAKTCDDRCGAHQRPWLLERNHVFPSGGVRAQYAIHRGKSFSSA
ncbi:hypothetical protein ACU8OL_18180 [Rhizobium leguminosarum]